jgi:hypothetical protein
MQFGALGEERNLFSISRLEKFAPKFIELGTVACIEVLVKTIPVFAKDRGLAGPADADFTGTLFCRHNYDSQKPIIWLCHPLARCLFPECGASPPFYRMGRYALFLCGLLKRLVFASHF